MAYLYNSINPFTVFIKKSLLFRDATISGNEEAEVLGIFSYKGYAPSFKILLNNGSIWDFCLPTYLAWEDNNSNKFSLSDLVYKNCPSCNFAVYIEDRLTQYPIDVYFKRSEQWSYSAEYILTLDWWTNNESVNLVKLINGQLAFVPNHKLLCRRDAAKLPLDLPKYRAFKDKGKVK